jgi:hypothetical protein
MMMDLTQTFMTPAHNVTFCQNLRFDMEEATFIELQFLPCAVETTRTILLAATGSSTSPHHDDVGIVK